ncbi:hypothetical protein BGW38_004354 [Lunasporangiospora selenospora]|uniref:RNA-dependent RNA polymerase n=1 Tax=Lunasporangiospora selenospora TaxID=979761 RepID=A0A9P6KC30_9FUNG|nr:hypothetical protein BGW38_004354 [Lunasporangiospora selenospora]
MDYTGREKPSDTAVNIYEVKKFFVNYALANNLGLIANAHLAMSDYLERGPLNRKCIMLAHLHSDAVDFPKSGVAVELDDELRPSQYPDFMEKPSDRTYASGNILGRIFRECKPSYDYEPKDYENSLNELFLIDGYEEYLDEARELKEVYDHDIQSLMNQYGVRSDLEIVSGFIMGTDIVTSKREYEIHKSISGAYSGLRRMYRKQFDKGLKSADLRTNQDHEIEKKAAAWYVASYERIDSEQMYSFAWVVWDVLCKLANRLRIGSSDHRIPELEGHNGSIIIIGEDGKPRLLNDERPTKAKDHLMTDGAKPFGLEPELKHGNGHGTKEQSNGHLIEPSPLQESNASTGLDTLFMDMCLGSNDSSSTDYDRNNISPYNKDMTISGMATSGLSNIDNYKSSNSNNRSSNNNSSSGSNDKGKGKNKWNSDRCSALKGPVNSSVSSNSTHSSCGTTGYLSPTGSVATSESLDYNTSKTSSWSDIFKINSGTSSNTSTSSSSSSNTSSSSSTWPNTWPNTKTSSNSSSNKDHSSISETIDFLFSEESESTEYLTGIKSWESIFQDNDDHNNNNDNDDHNNNNDNDDYNNNNDYDDINQNDKPARISSDCGGGGRNSPKFNNHVTQHDGYICIGPDVNDEELKKALMF